MTPIQIDAETTAEASRKYADIRDASGEGVSTFPLGEWRGHKISYNGKVWLKTVSGEVCIFNPYA